MEDTDALKLFAEWTELLKDFPTLYQSPAMLVWIDRVMRVGYDRGREDERRKRI